MNTARLNSGWIKNKTIIIDSQTTDSKTNKDLSNLFILKVFWIKIQF